MINKIDFKSKNLTSNAGLFLLLENAKSNLISITIDINSSVINVEGHQEGASKGYNPKKLGNRCYNIQFAFCDELKAYVTGFVRSGNTYTANGAAVKFVKGEEGRETTELFTKLDKWEKDRRFVVSRVLKQEKERVQLSLLEGSKYEYFFFVTNTALLSEKVVISHEKRGNAENYPYKEVYEKYLV